MHKFVFASALLLALISACTVKTVFYDVNPAYESHVFEKATIAVCPLNGRWKIEGTDTVCRRVPDFALYPEAVAKEIGKKRKCLGVLSSGMVAQKVPQIELSLFRHKLSYRKMDLSDSSAFRTLHSELSADYILFFENLFFREELQTSSDNTTSTVDNTILVFQLWDLKNLRFMYRGEAKGSGSVSKDSHPGSRIVENTARELVKALPVCR